MLSVRLPVSGLGVTLREPCGSEQLLWIEAPQPDLNLALALLRRLVGSSAADGCEPESWPLPDLDFLLLRLRQWLIGDLIRADVACAGEGCSERVDLAFRISDYLSHHAPKRAPRLGSGAAPGWYRLDGMRAEFRLPCAGDQLAAACADDPIAVLIERCVRPAAERAERRRIESAMAAIAPSLHDEIEIRGCVGCGASFSATFDPQRYVLSELRARALNCHEEIARVAAYFHWSERAILRLPLRRRSRYLEHARQLQGGS